MKKRFFRAGSAEQLNAIQCYDYEFVIASSIVYDHGCVPIGGHE